MRGFVLECSVVNGVSWWKGFCRKIYVVGGLR